MLNFVYRSLQKKEKKMSDRILDAFRLTGRPVQFTVPDEHLDTFMRVVQESVCLSQDEGQLFFAHILDEGRSLFEFSGAGGYIASSVLEMQEVKDGKILVKKLEQVEFICFMQTVQYHKFCEWARRNCIYLRHVYFRKKNKTCACIVHLRVPTEQRTDITMELLNLTRLENERQLVEFTLQSEKLNSVFDLIFNSTMCAEYMFCVTRPFGIDFNIYAELNRDQMNTVKSAIQRCHGDFFMSDIRVLESQTIEVDMSGIKPMYVEVDQLSETIKGLYCPVVMKLGRRGGIEVFGSCKIQFKSKE